MIEIRYISKDVRVKGHPKFVCDSSYEDMIETNDKAAAYLALRIKAENLAYNIKQTSNELNQSIS